MGKLVRDLIPKIIKDSGMEPVTRVISEEEYREKLFEKLIEEARELRDAQDNEHRIEELADVLEVVEAITMHFEISTQSVQDKKLSKNLERGGFALRIVLDGVNPKSD